MSTNSAPDTTPVSAGAAPESEVPVVPGKSLALISVDVKPLRRCVVTLPDVRIHIRPRHLPAIVMGLLITAGTSAYPAVSGSDHPIVGGIIYGVVGLVFASLVFSAVALLGLGDSPDTADESLGRIVQFFTVAAAALLCGVPVGPNALDGLGIAAGLSDFAAGYGTAGVIVALIAASAFGSVPGADQENS